MPEVFGCRGGAVAGAVLGSLETGVVVVVAEVPDIIRADPETRLSMP
jgi:hypothetical protein